MLDGSRLITCKAGHRPKDPLANKGHTLDGQALNCNTDGDFVHCPLQIGRSHSRERKEEDDNNG